MTYCVHEKYKHYETEIENWKEGYLKFINSKEPWKYDFKEGNEVYTENTHYEQSILSQLILLKYSISKSYLQKYVNVDYLSK